MRDVQYTTEGSYLSENVDKQKEILVIYNFLLCVPIYNQGADII